MTNGDVQKRVHQQDRVRKRSKLSRAKELLGRRSKVRGARSNRVDRRQAWLCSQCAGNLIEESTCSWAVRSEVDQSESELADVWI